MDLEIICTTLHEDNVKQKAQVCWPGELKQASKHTHSGPTGTAQKRAYHSILRRLMRYVGTIYSHPTQKLTGPTTLWLLNQPLDSNNAELFSACTGTRQMMSWSERHSWEENWNIADSPFEFLRTTAQKFSASGQNIKTSWNNFINWDLNRLWSNQHSSASHHLMGPERESIQLTRYHKEIASLPRSPKPP